VPVAAAVISAIEDAIGVHISEAPISPARIVELAMPEGSRADRHR